MKILFVTTAYPSPELPQYCIFLEQQVIALQKLGHRVDVYILADRQGKENSDYIYHGVRIFYRNVQKKRSQLGTLFPTKLGKSDELMLKKILSDGYDVVSLHIAGLECVCSVERMCKKQHIPLVMHFHGLNIWGDYFDSHRWLTIFHNITKKKALYSKFSATVNVSEAVKLRYLKKIRAVPSYVVYNGVDIDRFPHSADRRYFEGGTMKVLCVANMIPIKGQKYLIEAAGELRGKNISVHMTFAGRGPDEMMLKRLAADKKVEAEFVGYLPYDEIAELMRTHDVFCMPSFYEALGCVYLEAMSAGMITIGVRGQGIEEVIRDGENGFLVEPQSSDSIVAVMERIYQMNHGELSRISVCGAKTAEKFTWNNSALTLEKVYQKVIKGGRKDRE